MQGMHCFTSATLRGAVLMAVGFLLLLYTFGLFHAWLNLIIMISAIAMIVYGAVLTQVRQEIMKLIKHSGHDKK